MKITPLDIQQYEFKTKLMGYNRSEVDAFLERLADTFESLLGENDKLREKAGRLKLENEGHKKREETFKRAMLNSQKVLEQMKRNSQKSAELVLADAEVKAEKILSRAQNRLAELHEDISEKKRQLIQVESQIRSILETHSKLLDAGKEKTQLADEADAKIKLFSRP